MPAVPENQEEKACWLAIAEAAVNCGKRALTVPSLARAIALADHNIRIAFTAHTSWDPFSQTFSPEPYFISSSRHLRQAIAQLSSTAPSPDTWHANELTTWAALSKQTIYLGIQILNTPGMLSLAEQAHHSIRHVLQTHTSYNADNNNYGAFPDFLTSAHLLHAALIHLTLLSETPESSPNQPHHRPRL
jgi:hypothetical protein